MPWFEPEDHKWELYRDRLMGNERLFQTDASVAEFMGWLHARDLLPPAVEIPVFICSDPEIEYYDVHRQVFEVEYDTHYTYTDAVTGESYPVMCWAQIEFDLTCKHTDKDAYTVTWEMRL